MSDAYGDDFITISDEDGKEYELEVLATVEYNDATYLGVCPAGSDEEEEIEVSILKVTEEDGEEILEAVTDEDELAAVYDLLLSEEEDEEEEEEEEAEDD